MRDKISGLYPLTGCGASVAGLYKFANRRMPSCIGTARSHSIAIEVIFEAIVSGDFSFLMTATARIYLDL
jgi:hypothetical protein